MNIGVENSKIFLQNKSNFDVFLTKKMDIKTLLLGCLFCTFLSLLGLMLISLLVPLYIIRF